MDLVTVVVVSGWVVTVVRSVRGWVTAAGPIGCFPFSVNFFSDERNTAKK